MKRRTTNSMRRVGRLRPTDDNVGLWFSSSTGFRALQRNPYASSHEADRFFLGRPASDPPEETATRTVRTGLSAGPLFNPPPSKPPTPKSGPRRRPQRITRISCDSWRFRKDPKRNGPHINDLRPVLELSAGVANCRLQLNDWDRRDERDTGPSSDPTDQPRTRDRFTFATCISLCKPRRRLFRSL